MWHLRFPWWHERNLPFFITRLNLILIQWYCHNKQNKYAWKTKLRNGDGVGVPGVGTSLTVCWLAMTTQRHSAGCQHARPPEQLPGQTHRALIQPATGSPPLRSFFLLQALPVATITPSSVCTHPHYTMQVLIMTNLPTANSSSFESKTFLHKGGGQ